MFNVIKGNIINKNVKPVLINSNKKIKENTLIDQNKTSNELEEVNIQYLKEDKQYIFEEVEDEKEELNLNLENLKKDIEYKKEELAQLETRIEQILIEAKFESEKIIENSKLEAEEDINNIKAQAWDEGFQEGKKNGKNEIMSQAEEIYMSANKLLENASNRRKEILLDAKKEVVDLAFAIAKKIIKVEIKNKEVLYSNIIEALGKAPEVKKAKIYLNTENFSLSEEVKELISKSFRGLDTEIIEDHNLEPGGVIIETKLGRIDASIKEQLDALYDALEEV